MIGSGAMNRLVFLPNTLRARLVITTEVILDVLTDRFLDVTTTSPPTGLLGVGLGGDSSPRMVVFQAAIGG